MIDETTKRLLSAAARALERCQVADDKSGATAEAAHILEQVVTLDGTYVPPKPRMTPGIKVLVPGRIVGEGRRGLAVTLDAGITLDLKLKEIIVDEGC